jgi:hypothetical protein
MSVVNAVNTATKTPTDVTRLGTIAPQVQPTVNNVPSQTLANTVGTMSEQFQSAPAPAPVPAPAPQQSVLQKTLADIMGVSTQLESKGERTLEIQQEEGIFEKQARSKQIENEMMAKSRAYDKQIEEARKNQEGKLRGGVQIDMQGLEARKNSELADLAIQYKVANDDYAGAWSIAQAKIDAEFAPLVARLDTLKSYYQLAQNDMTESEKLQAQTKIREQESALDFQRTKELKAYEQTIRESDPMYQAQLRTEQAQAANIYDQMRERQSRASEEMLKATTEAQKKEAERKTKTEQALGMNQILKDLGSMSGMSSAVGVGFKKTFLNAIPFVSGGAVAGSARADFETQATRLSDMFLVDNLGKMTGVLTDKDLEVLRSEGTTIGNFNQSEESWLKELARLQAMVQRGIRENGITVEQAEFYGLLDPNVSQSLVSIWDNL